MELINNMKLILTNPNEFFKAVKNDKDVGYKKPWMFFAKIMAVYFFIFFIFSLPVIINEFANDPFLTDIYGNTSGTTIAVGLLISFLIYLLFYIILLAAVFAMAGITHLYLLIVGAQKGYIQTFRIICYSSTPIVFLAPFALFLVNPDYGEIIFFGVNLLLMIYMMIIQVKGAVVLQEISKARAIVSMVVIPLIVMVILFILILFIYYLIISSASPGVLY